jgi:signal recognition particle subunit SRP19
MTTPASFRWKEIYPAYIDAIRTQAEGRVVAVEFCLPKPTVEEIAHALKKLNVPHEIQVRYCLTLSL